MCDFHLAPEGKNRLQRYEKKAITMKKIAILTIDIIIYSINNLIDAPTFFADRTSKCRT